MKPQMNADERRYIEGPRLSVVLMWKSSLSGMESGHRSDTEVAEKLWDTDEHGHTRIIEYIQLDRAFAPTAWAASGRPLRPGSAGKRAPLALPDEKELTARRVFPRSLDEEV